MWYAFKISAFWCVLKSTWSTAICAGFCLLLPPQPMVGCQRGPWIRSRHQVTNRLGIWPNHLTETWFNCQIIKSASTLISWNNFLSNYPQWRLVASVPEEAQESPLRHCPALAIHAPTYGGWRSALWWVVSLFFPPRFPDYSMNRSSCSGKTRGYNLSLMNISIYLEKEAGKPAETISHVIPCGFHVKSGN